MSENLLPCPFCGGHGILIEVWDDNYTVKCGKCGVAYPEDTLNFNYDKDTAIALWNGRNERTCRFKPFNPGTGYGLCSACKGFMHETHKYCPRCGAKVVEE